jgi:hypothetical protein
MLGSRSCATGRDGRNDLPQSLALFWAAIPLLALARTRKNPGPSLPPSGTAAGVRSNDLDYPAAALVSIGGISPYQAPGSVFAACASLLPGVVTSASTTDPTPRLAAQAPSAVPVRLAVRVCPARARSVRLAAKPSGAYGEVIAPDPGSWISRDRERGSSVPGFFFVRGPMPGERRGSDGIFREVAPAIGICPAERPPREPGPALSEELVMAIAARLVSGWEQPCGP